MAGITESLQDLQNRGAVVTSVLSTDLVYLARVSTGEDVVITADNLGNSSGLSASTAETITGAWSFTNSLASFGGILSSNLVDKSAAETIPGVWSFGAGILVTGGGLNVNTGLSLKIFDSTDTDSLGILHDGTDVLFFHTGTTNWNISGLTGINLKDGSDLTLFDSTNTDFIKIAHDGTDVNFTHTSTTDWNITGITAIQAGTVDVDFDAITGTSYGGILEANLVDKSAAETVSGIWSYSSGILITGGGLNVRTGLTLQILDSTNTDNLRISHDGTDVNFFHTTTANWNITGITSIQAGTVDADFDAITATSYGGIVEANLVDKSAAETIPGIWSFGAGILVTGGGLNVNTGLSLKIFDSTDTDNLTILHDGTDVNFIHTGTTDWNITGITAIQAGTVDADFDAITGASLQITGAIKDSSGDVGTSGQVLSSTVTGTNWVTSGSGLSASTAETITGAWSFTNSSASFGGILSSNLLDKSAAETISGIWTFASLVATTADINGGTIDGTTIGATSRAAVNGTTGDFTGRLDADAGITFDTGTNTLSNYEEGTFTPVLSDGTNNATMTVQEGVYTRIGNRVVGEIRAATSSLGSVSGSLRITGLPFTGASGLIVTGGGVSTNSIGLAITAGQNVTLRIRSNQTFIDVFLWDDVAGTTSMQGTEWSANGDLSLIFSYRVD